MKFDLVPYGKPFHLILGIHILRPVNLVLRVFDSDTKRVFSERNLRLVRNRRLLVKFPIVPDRLTVELIEPYELSENGAFRLAEIKLERDTSCPLELTDQDKKFIRFAKWFALKCSSLDAGEKGTIYQSDDFSILYADRLFEDDIEQTTPARIDKYSGLIHVSQTRTKDYTVPMLIVVLLHEYAHMTKNREYGKKDSNELTADLIACHIALNLGFDSYEVRHCFNEIFKRKNTDLNKMRMKAIEEFISIFEKSEGERCKRKAV